MNNHQSLGSLDETFLDGEHALFLEQMYLQYQQAPESMSAEWREYFSGLDHSLFNTARTNSFQQLAAEGPEALERRSMQVKVSRLINAYRNLGHFQADTNPLGSYAYKQEVPQLTLEHHQLVGVDGETVFDPGSFNISAKPTLTNIISALKQIYVRSIGFEYMHIMDEEEKRWLQKRIELSLGRANLTADDRKTLLRHVTAAEVFEQYLHRRYVGQKRFGLEGGESLIPMLKTMVQKCGEFGAKEVVFGMAHRGRLNVLINVMCKPSGVLFAEFEGKVEDPHFTGDVKYHKGYSSDVQTPGGSVHMALAFNPSHLEIVSPVVEGSVRARQDRRGDTTGTEVLGIVIHGDAAFAGQGVVMETFNMAQTRGYRTHGTIHVVINNQVGFTTSTVADSRSTYYPTDVAKMINAPIFHVNGDDPEAVIYVAQLAAEYRDRFRKDVVVDLVCYRRLGHNEADEPAMTQPVMYDIIRNLATTRTQYANKLVAEGVLTQEEADGMVKAYRAHLENGDVVCENYHNTGLPPALQTHWKTYLDGKWRDQVNTTYTAERIKAISEAWISQIPSDFAVHPRVLKVFEARAEMGRGEKPADWGFGETLAYATLVEEGINVRLSGQDCGRGTFSHRHAVLHNQKQRQQWVPLKHVAPNQGNFIVIDSVLSEEAVLAFEYGYATAEPTSLVIWEAQFGDFVNGAQVVIDQFISSGEQKWNRLCGLVMFLPHGFEGQGPEHSSARLERFVQLCAQENMQIVVPSTPAQTFHMLRRQVHRNYRKPLIVFTPKSLLRHPLAVNDLKDFTEGQFQVVIDDVDAVTPEAKAKVERVVMCSGKVYYDLLEERRKQNLENVAIVRIEQLYPFPAVELNQVVRQYANMKTVLWCQEEPVNQGAWDGIRHRFEVFDAAEITCVSRPSSAAPAVGSLYVHQRQQRALVAEALGLTTPE
ncbi:MAG: 2-oxoglutarate dehydrogenase E1 component [Thiofilum sp.]|uniref:2-oxoglutarate dehydrogenase E1 component n=1 Tax=Thiofilum sp. TaxID=2212733 RepID=UPI0025F2B10E|nr:2-oxoglutarate dehydrogenase E1 component [Thiofilum sp.]MBK8451855.1 2-oxoglutarate dehydrogenase E1 component [Thiofilum sp.]